MLSIVPYSKRYNSPALYNPFHVFDEMERAFFNDRGIGEFKTDIRDAGEDFVLEADLPGFRKEDIDIDVDDNSLTIKAVRKNVWDEKDDDGKYVRSERAYGSFSRSFSISGIKSDEIDAVYENGVLRLRMPKTKKYEPKSRRLEIRSGETQRKSIEADSTAK